MPLQEKYQTALDFAAVNHRDQKVPGKEYSYVVHLANVAMEILMALRHSEGLDEELAVQCALLHDTIEDTDVSHEELMALFGKAVADGVMALTKDQDLPKEKRITDSLARIKAQPVSVGAVKLADRITNLQKPPQFWTKEKIAHYLKDAQQIYQELKHCHAWLSERLAQKMIEYKQLYLNEK